MSEPTTPRSDLPEDLIEHLRTPFDAVLTDPTRLRIQATLHGLPSVGALRFTALAKTLGLSDGNLSTHLAALSEVGYMTCSSTYTGKRRTRGYSATAIRREASEAHVRSLQLSVHAAHLGRSEPPAH